MIVHRSVVACLLFVAAGVSDLAAQDSTTLRQDLRIGGIDGPTALDLFGTVAVDDAGRMWIAQPRDSRIRVFAPDGNHLFDLGSRGDGPGEFAGLGKLYYRGGAVQAIDTRLRRLITFEDDGQVRDTHSLVGAAAATRGGDPYLFGDSILTVRDRTNDRGTVTGRFLTVVSMDGEGQRVLMEMPSYTTAVHQLDFGGGMTLRGPRLPFSDFVALAVAPDGSGIAVVDQKGAAAGERTTATVRVVHADGSRHSFDVPSAGIRVTREQVARTIAPALEELANLPNGPSRADAERILTAAVREEYHPPVSRLLIGRDGTIWVRRERADPNVDLWQIHDVEGALLDRVRVPAGATLLAADRNHVWARIEDELDVPYLVRYRRSS